MSRPTVHIPDDAPVVMATSDAYRRLREWAEVSYFDTLPGGEDRLIDRIRDAELVINIRSSSKFTPTVFESCPRLRLLSLWGTGTDNVDLEAASRRGVIVTNTPGVSAISIAEHCLALLIALARRMPAVDAQVRRGDWPRAQSSQLYGKALGIIGLGAIGRQFARIGAGIGMRVIAWTMHPKPDAEVEMVTLDRLYEASDVVSLHLRLSEQTRGMIGRAQFQRMKRTAIFLNTARGAIVDEAAMVDALASGRLAGAGLDVFETEPLPPGHPLTQLPNVVLTPHSAGITPEALEAGLQMSVDNVRNYLDGRPANAVTASSR
jgi:phosphoglycerate dehydrogenase-like enzyme